MVNMHLYMLDDIPHRCAEKLAFAGNNYAGYDGLGLQQEGIAACRHVQGDGTNSMRHLNSQANHPYLGQRMCATCPSASLLCSLPETGQFEHLKVN